MTDADAQVHSMSIFHAPRVVLITDAQEGCLSIRLGDKMTINVYGFDPFNIAPEVVTMTEREFAVARTNRIMGRAMGKADEELLARSDDSDANRSTVE